MWVCSAIIKRMKNNKLPLYSMTGDNGTEFSEHKKNANALDIDFYFTHPYSSWEKGTNKSTNGLIRQYFPKGTDFASITESMLAEVETALNNRPRKILHYKNTGSDNCWWKEINLLASQVWICPSNKKGSCCFLFSLGFCTSFVACPIPNFGSPK